MLYEMDKMVKLLFQRVSIERLLTLDKRKKVYFNQISPEYLQDLMLTYSQEFSDTERNLQIREIIDQVNESMRYLFHIEEPGTVNVFSILFFYMAELLTFHENRVVCRYRELLRWNELMRVIGEDLPVMAMLVGRDIEQARTCQDFSWAPIIGHNNTQLNKILERGMADNHFHLRGSAPYFYISWIHMMNSPEKRIFGLLDRIEKNYRDKNKKSEVLIQRQPLHILMAEAALIRFYLCCRLKGWETSSMRYFVDSLSSGRGDSATGCEEDWYRQEARNLVRRLLAYPHHIENATNILQSSIDGIALFADGDDYMMQFVRKQYQRNKEYQTLAGERWFIYHVLKTMLSQEKKLSQEEYNWFYAYLRIKTEIRSELVQANDITGFENFQIFQKRKDWFSHKGDVWESEGKLARMAIRSVLNNSAMEYLEVRISPCNTAYENKLTIMKYDRAVTKAYYNEDIFGEEIQKLLNKNGPMRKQEEDDLKRRFHYVLHFPKERDTSMDNEEDIETLECRHEQYREIIEKKAEEILQFRIMYPKYGQRVVGIDACSQEIGCRPEVFGKVFRTLKYYSHSYNDRLDDNVLPQLKLTYHVGEDYLDIADGLRAIDEAVRFLNLDCADRLGHALALGINVENWYAFKNRQITIPLQDYLDNLVWLHHALIRFNIDESESLKGWLEEKYSQYFSYIYQDNMKKERDSFQGRFDLNTYYLSWLLRGDQPSLYKEGRFSGKPRGGDYWSLYAVNKKNIRKDDIRYIPEVAFLYYLYHYSRGAKKRGNEIKTIHIPDKYINGVKAIQKAMMEEIASRGIAIETNPSSNTRIASYSKFGEHPIKTFYNLGLTKNERELMDCPQLNVSINTDDKGVFCTKLENEYALLACALEQEITETGNHRYKREFIYEWLNNIREMGIRQTFSNENENW